MKKQPYPKNEEEWNRYETNRVISGWVSGVLLWIAILWIVLNLVGDLAIEVEALDKRVRMLETAPPVMSAPAPMPSPAY